jgi:ArsR family transcriptional regulator
MDTKNNEDIIAIVARALSDKTRIRILKEIAAKGQVTCGEVEKIAELSQPTVSHHLKILIEAQLLNAQKDGRHLILSVRKETINEFNLLVSGSVSV